ncbi:MAG: redoxin domain-containing protein [Pseudomonadota bacterium]
MKLLDRHTLFKRGFDAVLIIAVIYALLLATGIIRRGGRFEEGRSAPDFQVQSLRDGKTYGLSDFSGKTLVMTFFSTTCPSCKRELPELHAMKDEVGDEVEFLIVTHDNPLKVRAYMKSQDLDFHVAHDNGGTHDAYAVDTIPYSVVITPDGSIKADVIGALRMTDIL